MHPPTHPLHITIYGAGAIGSLLGAHLSRHHHVTLIGHPPHITTIQQHGLTITGHTHYHATIPAHTTLTTTKPSPDLIIVTVKAYDTPTAATDIQRILTPSTIVLSLQNGLGNIETLQTTIPATQLIAGVTTHGARLTTPGTVTHTGTGTITIGELTGTRTPRIQTIATALRTSGLPTTISTDITTDLWKKTIANAAINPLTAYFTCPNSTLLTNPILRHTTDHIITESTHIAHAANITIQEQTMKKLTHSIIRATAHNHSSMLQSLEQGKRTEIDALNGTLATIATHHHLQAPLNTLLTSLIHWKEHQPPQQ
jgi:2-dehydropantoate 2-reductase